MIRLSIGNFVRVRSLITEEFWRRFLQERAARGIFGVALATEFVQSLTRKKIHLRIAPLSLYTAFPDNLIKPKAPARVVVIPSKEEAPAHLRMAKWDNDTEGYVRIDPRQVMDQVLANEIIVTVQKIIGEMSEPDAAIATLIIDHASEDDLSESGFSSADIERVRNLLRDELGRKGYGITDAGAERPAPAHRRKQRGGFTASLVPVVLAAFSLVVIGASLDVQANMDVIGILRQLFSVADVLAPASMLLWIFGTRWSPERRSLAFDSRKILPAAPPLSLGLANFGASQNVGDAGSVRNAALIPGMRPLRARFNLAKYRRLGRST
jgi:hypothetical protein